MRHFSPCFKALQAENPAEIPPEYSLRPELEALLAEIAADVDSSISIRREGRREGKFGASDFKITRMGSIADYIENKKIGENPDRILKSGQIRKYRQLSDNLPVTNYLKWI